MTSITKNIELPPHIIEVDKSYMFNMRVESQRKVLNTYGFTDALDRITTKRGPVYDIIRKNLSLKLIRTKAPFINEVMDINGEFGTSWDNRCAVYTLAFNGCASSSKKEIIFHNTPIVRLAIRDSTNRFNSKSLDEECVMVADCGYTFGSESAFNTSSWNILPVYTSNYFLNNYGALSIILGKATTHTVAEFWMNLPSILGFEKDLQKIKDASCLMDINISREDKVNYSEESLIV